MSVPYVYAIGGGAVAARLGQGREGRGGILGFDPISFPGGVESFPPRWRMRQRG